MVSNILGVVHIKTPKTMNGEFLKLKREQPRNGSDFSLVVVTLSEGEDDHKMHGLYIGAGHYSVHMYHTQTGETNPTANICVRVEEKGGSREEVVYLREEEGGNSRLLSDGELNDLRFSFVDWSKVEG